MTTILFLYTVLNGPKTVEVGHARAATMQEAREMLCRRMHERNLRRATLQLQAVPDNFDECVAAVRAGAPDHLVVAHQGHGINSYAFSSPRDRPGAAAAAT
jgi:hypothetical protein